MKHSTVGSQNKRKLENRLRKIKTIKKKSVIIYFLNYQEDYLETIVIAKTYAFVGFELDSMPKRGHRFSGFGVPENVLKCFWFLYQSFLTPLTFSCHLYYLTRLLLYFTAFAMTASLQS